MLNWVVAQTKYKEEDRARDNLRHQEFDVFLPKLREMRKKEKIVEVPTFPGYIFVQIDLADNEWKRINSTRGVYKIMTSRAEIPSRLPLGWVERMIALGEVIDNFAPIISYKSGEMLEFIDGPFAGKVGICQWTSSDRVALLLDVLGNKNIVYCNISSLRLAQVGEIVTVR